MLKLKIESMSCNHCISLITKAIKQLEASAEVTVDLATHTASISSGLDEQEILFALEEAGYAATKSSCCCSNEGSSCKA